MELTPLILDRFKRVNDKLSPDLIGQDELVTLTDAVLDYKIGKPVKRGHFSRYDAGIPAGADILKLADVKSKSAQQNILAAVTTGLVNYNPTTNLWANIKTGLTSGFKFRYVPFADKFIFTFDTDDDPIMASNNMNGGTHTGSNNAAVLTDSTKGWIVDELVGLTVYNVTDGSNAVITANTANTITATLAGGTDNDWDTNDVYAVETKTWNLELATATVTAIQSFHKGSTGELTANTLYKYVIVGVTEDGQMSPPSKPFTHIYASTTYRTTDDGTNSDSIFFQNLPYIADSRIVNRFIFRTKSEEDLGQYKTGEIYYLHSILDNDYTGTAYQKTLLDNTADDDLGTEIAIYLNTPTRARYIAYSNERLILGNFSEVDYNHFSPASTQTGGTPPTEYSTYTDGFELSGTDTDGGAGTLDDSTQYDYRIHYVDEFGRYSKFYNDVTVTTDAGTGADDHHITIYHIGGIGKETAKIVPQIAIFRRTGGTGSYYLLGKFDINGFADLTTEKITVYAGGHSFVDWGAANLTETWVDPATQINAYPSAICFSEISSPSTIRDEDKRQIYPDDGTAITGLFDDQDGVVIFKTNSTNKVFISGNPINWRLVQLCRNYGCDQPETIQKSGSSYYFIYQNKAYRYDYGAEKPVDIGALFQGTLDSITTFYDSTINDRWYCIQCLLVSTPYTLIYDMKLDTWYKFKRTQSDSEDFKTIYFTKYGSTEQLLSNADAYITQYNNLNSASAVTRADTEIGSTQQISPVIRTKTFKSPDGITLTRLRKLKFDYRKLDGQNVTVTITDDDIPSTIVLTDSTDSSNANYTKLYESGIGRDTDTLKETRSFYVTIQGAGLERFDSLRIEGRPIHKGKQVSA